MMNSHRQRIGLVLAVLVTAFSGSSLAQGDSTQVTLPALDAALQKKIEQELIAPCCWNMTVDQHESPASRQVRAEIARLVAAGESKEDILDYMVTVYGERILARPRRTGFNILAYVLPVLALGIGTAVVMFFLRRRVAPAFTASRESAAVAGSAKDAAWEQQVEDELKTTKS